MRCSHCDWFELYDNTPGFSGWMMDLHHALVHPREWATSWERTGMSIPNIESCVAFYLDNLRQYTPDPRVVLIDFATYRSPDDEDTPMLYVYDPMPD